MVHSVHFLYKLHQGCQTLQGKEGWLGLLIPSNKCLSQEGQCIPSSENKNKIYMTNNILHNLQGNHSLGKSWGGGGEVEDKIDIWFKLSVVSLFDMKIITFCNNVNYKISPMYNFNLDDKSQFLSVGGGGGGGGGLVHWGSHHLHRSGHSSTIPETTAWQQHTHWDTVWKLGSMWRAPRQCLPDTTQHRLGGLTPKMPHLPQQIKTAN